MEIAAFRHLWGLEQEPLAQSLPRIAEGGYAGVEAILPSPSAGRELGAAAASHGLAFKPLFELSGPTPEHQLAEYRGLLESVAGAEPAGVTVHSGRDSWPRAEAVAFYREAVAIEAGLGLEAGHETHRGRPLSTPWSTVAILDAVPELRLVCDFSHWVLVCERLLEDQTAAIEAAAARAVHLHARVGFEQGPQVADPRSPESATALAAHEAWWELVWEAQRAAAAELTTFTPEYGPPPYLPRGLTRAHLEDVCDWQMHRTRERFGSWRERPR